MTDAVNMYKYEEELQDEGINLIAGVDEAGRGPIAGPLVIGLVVFPPFYDNYDINDCDAVVEVIKTKGNSCKMVGLMYDRELKKVITLCKVEMEFAYKKSIFQSGRFILLEAEF